MRTTLCPLAILFALAGCQSDQPEPQPDASSPGPGPAAGVVAVVNGVNILQRDLAESLEQVKRTLGAIEMTAEENARLRDQVLDKLVKDELMVQHARSLGLSVSDEEVEAREATIKASGGGEDAFARFVDSSGLDPDRLRHNLKRNLLIERLIARLRAEVKLDEAQLRAHYEAHPEAYSIGGRLEIAHLALGDEPDAMDRAKRIRAEIAQGLDFAKAVRRHSQDAASKDKAGLLGEFAPDDLLPVFARALAELKPGGVSAPVKAPDGVHLLRLVSRTEARLRPFDEVRERIQTFGPGGGFVFNTVHNVQPGVPVENLLAMYETVREYGAYPIR